MYASEPHEFVTSRCFYLHAAWNIFFSSSISYNSLILFHLVVFLLARSATFYSYFFFCLFVFFGLTPGPESTLVSSRFPQKQLLFPHHWAQVVSESLFQGALLFIRLISSLLHPVLSQLINVFVLLHNLWLSFFVSFFLLPLCVPPRFFFVVFF